MIASSAISSFAGLIANRNPRNTCTKSSTFGQFTWFTVTNRGEGDGLTAVPETVGAAAVTVSAGVVEDSLISTIHISSLHFLTHHMRGKSTTNPVFCVHSCSFVANLLFGPFNAADY